MDPVYGIAGNAAAGGVDVPQAPPVAAPVAPPPLAPPPPAPAAPAPDPSKALGGAMKNFGAAMAPHAANDAFSLIFGAKGSPAPSAPASIQMQSPSAGISVASPPPIAMSDRRAKTHVRPAASVVRSFLDAMNGGRR